MIELPEKPGHIDDVDAVTLTMMAEAVAVSGGVRMTPPIPGDLALLLVTNDEAFGYFRGLVEYHSDGVSSVRRIDPALLIGEHPDGSVFFVVCPFGVPEDPCVRTPEDGYWQPYVIPLEGGQATPAGFATMETVNMRRIVAGAQPFIDRGHAQGEAQLIRAVTAAQRWLVANIGSLFDRPIEGTSNHTRRGAIDLMLEQPEFTIHTLYAVCYLLGLNAHDVIKEAFSAERAG